MHGEENRQRELARYAIPIAAVGVAALVWWGARLVLIPDALGATTVAMFASATLVAAWLAGTGPGFAATAGGALLLLFLSSGPQHTLTLLAPRDVAVIVASTVLSALFTVVVSRLRESHSALMQGLPEIERRARDRANDAAARTVEQERRKAAAAKEDVADVQRRLQQWKDAASTAANARAEYLATTKLAVRLPLRALAQYAARLDTDAGDVRTPLPRREVAAIAMCEEHLATLLDTVLVPARVESGQFVPWSTDVSLSEVVPQAVALVEPLLAAQGSTVECGNLDVGPVRADAAILVQLLARLVLEEATTRPGALRLEAKQSDDVVTLECKGSSENGRTSDAKPVDGGREDMERVTWSSLAAAERLAQMGGTSTVAGVSGAASRFTISLPTRRASDVDDSSTPVILWPPVAFEFPGR